MTSRIFIFAIVILYQYVGAVDPLVDSRAGLIRGQVASDGDYSMFLGIPYARVDEENPFGPSIPYATFEGTFEAFDDSAICPQISEFDSSSIVGTLDCLHLNVYVPNGATSSNPLPVLVWIHGGGFTQGFSGRNVFGPKFLVRHDVILVTLNYRLGPYGFMCLDTPAASGNQGLKDQQLALRWVKDNIVAFGGDVNKITIFGESAGAASVDFHVHLDQENLFHQAILQSGSVLNPWAIKNPGNEGSLKLAEHLGLTTSDVNDALSFLASVDSSLIIASTRDLGLIFRPCIENKFDNVEPFLTDHPINLLAPKASQISLLLGITSDEGFVVYSDIHSDYLNATVNECFDFDSHTFDEMSEILRHFYFGDKDISDGTERQILDFSSDLQFVHPAQRSLRRFFDSGAQSVFSYMFSYVGQRNYFKYFNNITYGGAAHADELSFLFDVLFVETVMPDEDQTIVDRITTLWTNFAKHGNPTPETSELLPVTWIPATPERWNYLNIDSELTMETRPFSNRMAFLDLFYKMNDQYQIGYHKFDESN